METIETIGVKLTGTAAGLVGMLAQAESAVSSVFGRMAKIGASLSFGITLPLVGLAGTATKTFAGFETSLQQTVGLAGVAQSEIGGISDEILRMGPGLGQGPRELAEAFYFISSSGLHGADAMEALRYSAMASAAGLGETKVIADIVTSTMNAWGSSVLSAQQAADVLVATVREGKGEPAQLAAGLGQVIPIASAMGLAFHEVGATVAGMTRTGTSAETAAMQLKNILSSIAAPARESETAMRGLGLSSAMLRDMLKSQGLLPTLLLLKDRFGDNVDATAAVFGNIRALTGILDLLGSNMQENVAIYGRMANAAGDLDHAFASISDTVQFKWSKLVAQLQVGLVQIGRLLAPTFKDMLDRLQQAVVWWNALSDNTKKSIVLFASIAAAAGPVLLLVAALGKLAMFLVGMSPLLAVVGGIAVGLGVMAQAAGGWGALWERVKGLIVSAGEAIAGALARVFDFGNRLWQIMGVRLVSAGIVLTGVFLGLWEAAKLVGSAIAAAFDFITGPAESLGGVTGSLLALAGVLIAGLATWRALTLAIGLAGFVLDLLGLKVVVNTAAWVVWQATILAVQGLGLSLLFVFGLITGALTAMQMAIGAGVVVGVAAAALAVWSLWEATKSLMGVLAELPTTSGPIGAIRDMFGEWWVIIQQIVRAFRVDMALGWEAMKIGLQIALEDVRTLFPPLWEAIKTGFTALWTYVSDVFVIKLKQGLYAVLRTVADNPLVRLLAPAASTAALAGLANMLSPEALEGQLAAANTAVSNGMAAMTTTFSAQFGAMQEARDQLTSLVNMGLSPDEAAAQLVEAGFSQDQVQAALRAQGLRDQFAGVMGRVDDAAHWQNMAQQLGMTVGELDAYLNGELEDVASSVAPAAQQAGQQIGEQFAGGLKDSMVKGIDAVAVGSAEAVARVGSYLAGFADVRAVGAAVGNAVGPQVNAQVNAPGGAAPVPVDAAARAGGQEMVDVLKEIKAVLVEKLDSLISGQGEQIELTALGGV